MHNEIVKIYLLGIVVCSSGSEDEALEWVRVNSSAGTMNNWCKIDSPKENELPVKCSEGKGTHYLFTC